MARGDLALSVTLNGGQQPAGGDQAFRAGRLAFQDYGGATKHPRVPATQMNDQPDADDATAQSRWHVGARHAAKSWQRMLEPKISLFGALFLGALILSVLVPRVDR